MNAEEWAAEAAERTDLGERQALALFLRQTGVTSQEAAERMDCSRSNVYNLDDQARQKVEEAKELMELVGQLGDESKFGLPLAARDD